MPCISLATGRWTCGRRRSRRTPDRGQVLVAMRAAALCGTDVHTYHLPAEALPAYPIIRGHAPAGMVAAVGPNVSNVAPGDHVSVYQYPRLRQPAVTVTPAT